jgi:hypothetical protein
MSNPIVTLQIAPPKAPPRGALWIGAFAGTLWSTVRDMAQAVAGASAVRVPRGAESRHG